MRRPRRTASGERYTETGNPHVHYHESSYLCLEFFFYVEHFSTVERKEEEEDGTRRSATRTFTITRAVFFLFLVHTSLNFATHLSVNEGRTKERAE